MRRKLKFLILLILFLIGYILVLDINKVKFISVYDTTLSLYINDEVGNTIPTKDSGYIFDSDRSFCTNATLSWDTDSWSPIIKVSSESNE